MRSFEMQIYTLLSEADLAHDAGTVHPRHLRSVLLFEVNLHGFWTRRNDDKPKLFALGSHAEGDNPGEVDDCYMKSGALAKDVRASTQAPSLASKLRAPNEPVSVRCGRFGQTSCSRRVVCGDRAALAA